MNIGLIILGIAIISIIGYVIMLYNRFQLLNNASEATLGQIKVELKKRLDMISQLVEAVKKYAKFEKETLMKITELRTSVVKTNSAKDINKIARESRQILGRLSITLENYPDLKTSSTVNNLMNAIKQIEDEISRHRYTYNNIIQEFNTKLTLFPSNIIGQVFGFKKKDYLQFKDEVNNKPKIEI